MKRLFIVCLAIIFVAAVPAASVAACRHDPRTLRLKQADNSPNVSKLNGYNCGEFSVEFEKLSNLAATMMVSGQNLTLLTSSLGKFDVVHNDTYKKYSDMMEKFSTIFKLDGSGNPIGQHLQVNDSDEAGVVLGLKRASYSLVTDYLNFYYPAVPEIKSLNRGVVPDNMNVYFFSIGGGSPFPVFWRDADMQDITDLDVNAALLKKEAQSSSLHFGVDDGMSEQGRSENFRKFDAYLRYVSGTTGLPSGFMHLTGYGSEDECGHGTNTNWNFTVSAPTVNLKVALVRNTSKRALKLDAMLGRNDVDVRLREIGSAESAASSEGSKIDLGMTVQPGRALLIPLQITLEPSNVKGHIEPFSSDEVAKRLREEKMTFRADVARTPPTRTYTFGPQIDLTGLDVNGTPIRFDDRSSNYIDVSFSYEGNSCPFLSAYEPAIGKWVELGTILDKFNEASLIGTQTRTLPGMVLKYRLEEREAEVSTITKAVLQLVLRNKSSVFIEPSAPLGRAHIGLGDVRGITFVLPSFIAPSDVEESRLSVTGFYQRYSDLEVVRSNSTDPGQRKFSNLFRPAAVRRQCSKEIQNYSRP